MKRTLFFLVCIAASLGDQYNYCQMPKTTPSLNTTGLTLIQVQVVFRHGDRTPTVPLPVWPAVWDCSPDFLVDHSYSRHSVLPPPSRMHRLVMIPGREDLKGNCALGQLTAKGYEMHLSLGGQYRDMYVDTYGLLPSNFNASEMWVRSSNVPRTIQSLMGNLRGMFPPTPNGGQPVEVIDIHTMDQDLEDLWANPAICPRLTSLEQSMSNSPEYKARLAELGPLFAKMETVFNSTNPPTWSNLFDNLWARHCHGLGFPPGTSFDSTLHPISEFVDFHARFFWLDPLYSQLSFSPLLSEILLKFSMFVNRESTEKYVAYSAHDTTVGPLAALIGAWDGVWPPYASHLEIELWQSETSSDMFFQVKYNGVVAEDIVPGCGTMCPYDQWMAKMKSHIPPNYQQLCTM